MKIEATLDDKGHLELARPLRLRHPWVRVEITVPDEEIEGPLPVDAPEKIVEGARAMLARMEAIKNAPLSPDEEPDELSEEQRERMEAFALRDEIKGLRES